MQVISSKDNRIIKEAASLSEKKYRDELESFLVEGPNIVKEAMQQGGRVRFIFTLAGTESDEIKEILSEAEAQNLAVYELTSDVFAKVTQTNTPQAIVAVMKKRQIQEQEFFETVSDKNILVLDRLQDPGNVGTVIRTAEAMGFGGLMVLKGTADVYQPKVVRSAAGSLLRFPVLFANTAAECMEILERNNKKIYATAMNGKECVCDANLKSDVAIVIGNEGNGVCKELLEKASTLSIPMQGQTESINAAISAAIVMYESLRQRR